MILQHNNMNRESCRPHKENQGLTFYCSISTEHRCILYVFQKQIKDLGSNEWLLSIEFTTGRYWFQEVLFSRTRLFDLGCTKLSRWNLNPAERPGGVDVISVWFPLMQIQGCQRDVRCDSCCTYMKKRKNASVLPRPKLKGDLVVYYFCYTGYGCPSFQSISLSCHALNGNYLSLHCERLYHILASVDFIWCILPEQFVSE